MKIKHYQYAQIPQGGLLKEEFAKHCMKVTRHRLVHLLCVIAIERWMTFDIFNPCKLSEKKEDLIHYGNNKLQDLGENYAMGKNE